jgi:hypothetical protein
MALWMGILPASFGMVSWKGTIWFDYPHLGVFINCRKPTVFLALVTARLGKFIKIVKQELVVRYGAT